MAIWGQLCFTVTTHLVPLANLADDTILVQPYVVKR